MGKWASVSTPPPPQSNFLPAQWQYRRQALRVIRAVRTTHWSSMTGKARNVLLSVGRRCSVAQLGPEQMANGALQIVGASRRRCTLMPVGDGPAVMNRRVSPGLLFEEA